MPRARAKRLVVVPEERGDVPRAAPQAAGGRPSARAESVLARHVVAGPRAAPGTNSWAARVVRLLVLLSAVLLGLGLIAPAMDITTSFGRYDGWLRLLAPEMIAERQSRYSLLGGILALIENGNLWLGLLLIGFTVVFPTLKLMLMSWANETLARRQPAGRLLALAHHAGKFSMLDVLVLAMLVLAIKGLPGNSDLRLQWGVGAFALSVILSLIASLLLHRLERHPRPPADAAPTAPRPGTP